MPAFVGLRPGKCSLNVKIAGHGSEAMKKFLLSAAVLLAFVLANGPAARAQTRSQITLVAPGGIRAAIVQLIPGFERTTGHFVKATFGSGNGTKQQVMSGAAFDVPILQPPYTSVLASGNVIPGSARPLATVSVGVAVRQGPSKPDISTPDAVKRMLLAAKAISYPDPSRGAAAGVSFEGTLRTLGIFDQVQPKIQRAQGGAAAMRMVANGQVDIGLTFMSEMDEPGIYVVGPLPRQISTPTTLVGFVSAHAADPDAASALLSYLSAPAAAPAYKAHGMQPIR